MAEQESVWVFSGVHSKNFSVGYDPRTGIYDRRKVVPTTEHIHCFPMKNDELPRVGDRFTDLALGLGTPVNSPKGSLYLLVGEVPLSELKPGEFCYLIGPTMPVETIYELRKGIFGKSLDDITERLCGPHQR
jgi:hypothetical protein